MNNLKYIIVYPGGVRTHISMTQAYDYEIRDYDQASQREFDDKDECETYMKHLSEKHNIPIEGDKPTAYLD